jgi:hypothetical protein
MPNLHFTREEVEAQAGAKKPWTRQRDFRNEINPDDMADTAAAYARAAAEARGTQDLAERATQISQQAGTRDGSSLVDGQGRIEETRGGLLDGGARVDSVVRHIVQAMNAALATEDRVRALIYAGGTGLETRYTNRLQAAVDEWNGWQQALGAAVAAYNSDPVNTPVPLAVPYGGRLEYVPASGTGPSGGFLFSLPDQLAERIRTDHLRLAAQDAGATWDEMEAEIGTYRRRLAAEADELTTLGYAVSEGPLGLFTNAPMAQWSAEQLNLELAKDNPDEQLLGRYVQGLEAITGGVYGDPLNPSGDPARDLTRQEATYLERFYATLTPDALGSLGRLDAGAAFQRTNVANGIAMLTNPAIGGLDPANPAHAQAIPASIREFVYDYRDSGLLAASSPGGLFTGDHSAAWQRFNGFGEVMAAATVTPGDRFSRDLAHAAVDIEKWSQQPLTEGYVPPVNTGSSGLLQAAALNTGVSADLLNEEGFRHDLINQGWDDSTGAGELIRSGTSLPPGVGPGDPAARAPMQAAFNVLADAPDYRGSLLTPGADNAALQTAIGDTAYNWLPMLAKPATEATVTAFSPTPFDNLYGVDYASSFSLTPADRNAVFSLLQASGDDVWQRFGNQVSDWEARMAMDAFRLDRETNVGHAGWFEAIGRVEGAMQQVEAAAGVSPADSARGQASLVAGASTVGTVVNTFLDARGARIAVTAGALLGSQMLNHLLPAPPTAADFQAEAMQQSDSVMRGIVAEAAQASGVNMNGGGDARDYGPLPDLAADPHNSVLHERHRLLTSDIEEEYGSYRDAMLRAYDAELHGSN